MVAVVVMQSMALGDGGDVKEENSFSDCRHRQPPKGEADNNRHGFLYLYQPLIEATNYRLAKRLPLPPLFPAVVTPSANRNSYRVATPYYIYTQGRGATHLNPGL